MADRSGFQVLVGAVPYSQEAEEAVIGAVLVNPNAFVEVAEFLIAEDFYILRHIYIWEALSALYDESSPVDYLTVQVKLSNMGKLIDIGGPAYIIQLINNTPTSMHAVIYGELVWRCAMRRRLLNAADQIKGEALNEEQSWDKTESEVTQHFMSVFTRTTSTQITWSQGINRVLDRLSDRMDDEGEDIIYGIPTWHDVDLLISGLQQGSLHYLAGRPGSGKTSAMFSMALRQGRLNADVRMGLLTQEMNHDQVVQRFLSMESGVPLKRIVAGKLTQTEWAKVIKAAGIIGQFIMNVDDTTGLEIRSATKKVNRWAHDTGIDVLYIDYIQLLEAGRDNYGRLLNSRFDQVSFISAEAKKIAKNLNIPVVAAAQLSREVDDRKDHHPVMSDLKESGNLEQDADVIMFMFRPAMYDETADPYEAEIIVAKDRNGPTGKAPLRWNPTTTYFSDQTYNRELLNLNAL